MCLAKIEPWKPRPRVEVSLTAWDNAVVCPHCGKSCDMHPTEVEVFMRNECAGTGNYAAVDLGGGMLRVNRPLPPGNPSSYRQGLTISFECYYCGKQSRLGVAQHKGSTYLDWLERG